MARCEQLSALDERGEGILRAALAEFSDDIEDDVATVANGLAEGNRQACLLLDESDTPRGIAVWRWGDESQRDISVDWLYTDNDADPALGEALVDALWSALQDLPGLQMIGARVRGNPPGIREALDQRDAVVFERGMMIADLFGVGLPEVAPANGYRMTRWEDSHEPEVERIAQFVQRGSIDEVVVAEAQGDRIAEGLRKMRAGKYPGVGPWVAPASFVVLAEEGGIAGYIATVDMGFLGFVADVGVHPDHRRKGLGRWLIAASMAALAEQGFPSVALAVTLRNPAKSMYESLGFELVQSGQTAVWWHDGRQIAWRE